MITKREFRGSWSEKVKKSVSDFQERPQRTLALAPKQVKVIRGRSRSLIELEGERVGSVGRTKISPSKNPLKSQGNPHDHLF